MLKKSLLFLIAFFLYFPLVSLAATYDLTGEKLLAYCQIAMDLVDNNYGRAQIESEYLQGSKSGICQGYLMSVNEIRNQNHKKICLLNDCMLKRIAVVVKYLKDHPQQLQQPASTLVFNAYQMYFPCR